jgi:hypothetical protein
VRRQVDPSVIPGSALWTWGSEYLGNENLAVELRRFGGLHTGIETIVALATDFLIPVLQHLFPESSITVLGARAWTSPDVRCDRNADWRALSHSGEEITVESIDPAGEMAQGSGLAKLAYIGKKGFSGYLPEVLPPPVRFALSMVTQGSDLVAHFISSRVPFVAEARLQEAGFQSFHAIFTTAGLMEYPLIIYLAYREPYAAHPVVVPALGMALARLVAEQTTSIPDVEDE